MVLMYQRIAEDGEQMSLGNSGPASSCRPRQRWKALRSLKDHSP